MAVRSVDFEVAVVGAGPAGCTAAHRLARGGVSVVLLEKAKLPRPKVCGGGVVARARRLLPDEIGPLPSLLLHAAELRCEGLELCARIESRVPLLEMVMRADLDHALARAAAAAGATVADGEPVTAIARLRDRVTLDTPRRRLAVRFLLAADGAAGACARLLELPAPRAPVPALEAEVAAGAAELARFAGVARFDLRYPRGGYAWVFPKKGHLSIGVGSTARRPPPLRDALTAYLGRLGLAGAELLDVRGFVIPARPRPQASPLPRTLLLGDALGLADPVTLEGISHALASGELAARALLETRLAAGGAERAYASLLRRDVLPELRAARMFAKLVYAPDRIALPLLRRFGERGAALVGDVLLGQGSWRKLLARAVRLRLGSAAGVAGGITE